ncbi:hypothetical protein K402DRAFT_97672 [Aulographum hederae CBS 113979]|uniref:25S rRNA (uridine-N(3))-methyltransferase BMT5-like domain-containing protein n=1 Tax=Aulographum hederae CBS 113979 TaxID=1176131 RepID=A0A6G1GYI5_9PEZI|nr:hypothetical protein K402DRAFT_97672 [Aulographum hederae CBS 113979]
MSKKKNHHKQHPSKRARVALKTPHQKPPSFSSTRTTKPSNAASMNANKSPSSQRPTNTNTNPTHPPRPSQTSTFTLFPTPLTSPTLLIGDGDFSFASSLVLTYGARSNLLATCYDSRQELERKYPQAVANIAVVEEHGGRVMYGVDGGRLGVRKVRDGWRGGECGKGKKGGWERIVFNFPHVGGRTRDVNRQVRFNQELISTFLTSALPLLSPTGTVLVTLFTGEPYTLWNINNLGRHCGYAVQRSCRFEWEMYPGYGHVRTVGNIVGREGREGREGKEGEEKKGGEREGKDVEEEEEKVEDVEEVEKEKDLVEHGNGDHSKDTEPGAEKEDEIDEHHHLNEDENEDENSDLCDHWDGILDANEADPQLQSPPPQRNPPQDPPPPPHPALSRHGWQGSDRDARTYIFERKKTAEELAELATSKKGKKTKRKRKGGADSSGSGSGSSDSE